MISLAQAAILGALQGLAELFPISSLGHSVILPGLLGWRIDQSSEFFLLFLVTTHFATALVLFLFYWRDWMRIIAGIFRSLRDRRIAGDADAKLGWLLIVGTVPAGIVGLLFQHQVQDYFLSATSAAFFLMLNGILLWFAERLRRRAVANEPAGDADRRIAKLGWWQAFKVGIAQVLALIPGFSRTGATLAGSLLVGLSHEDAMRYSFLLATPIIGAAAALKLPKLALSAHREALPAALLGAVCAAIAAYLTVRFLTKYFKTKTLSPFAAYCFLAGALSLAYFLFRG